LVEERSKKKSEEPKKKERASFKEYEERHIEK